MIANNNRNDLIKKITLLGAVSGASKALVSSLDEHQVLTTILTQVSRLIEPNHWALYLLNEQTCTLNTEIAVNLDSSVTTGTELSSHDTIADWVLTNKRPLLSPDFRGDARLTRLPPRYTAIGQGSLLAIPLLFKEQTLGFIELINDQQMSFNEDHLALLVPFADMVAIAINNSRCYSRLEKLNYLDDCTALYNARYLQKCLLDEVQRSLRYSHPLSCIFLDLDHFKLVNDNYGHLLGTALLREVAVFLRSSLRGTDIAFRYGGDEFVILMPETTMDGAKEAAKRLLTQLQQQVFLKEHNLSLKISASFGVSTLDLGMNGQDLLSLADQAMYWVKEHGRNAMKLARTTADLD